MDFILKQSCSYWCINPAATDSRDKMAALLQTTFSNAFFPYFFHENVWISINISLKFVPEGTINNIPALVQILAWCLPGDKPVSKLMVVSLLTHICATRPQRCCTYLIRYRTQVLGLHNDINKILIRHGSTDPCYWHIFQHLWYLKFSHHHQYAS